MGKGKRVRSWKRALSQYERALDMSWLRDELAAHEGEWHVVTCDGRAGCDCAAAVPLLLESTRRGPAYPPALDWGRGPGC